MILNTLLMIEMQYYFVCARRKCINIGFATYDIVVVGWNLIIEVKPAPFLVLFSIDCHQKHIRAGYPQWQSNPNKLGNKLILLLSQHNSCYTQKTCSTKTNTHTKTLAPTATFVLVRYGYILLLKPQLLTLLVLLCKSVSTDRKGKGVTIKPLL